MAEIDWNAIREGCRFFWDTAGWPHEKQRTGYCYCAKRDFNFGYGNDPTSCEGCGQMLPSGKTNLEALVESEPDYVADILAEQRVCERCVNEEACELLEIDPDDMTCFEGNLAWLKAVNPAWRKYVSECQTPR